MSIKNIGLNNPDYPFLLKNIHNPPKKINIDGNIKDFNFLKSISIVGTRRVTNYGRKCIDWLINNCSLNNVNVISGLAYGVDTVTHELSIKYGVKSCIVLPLGFEKITPISNINLYKSTINKGGIAISEDLDYLKYNKYFFPRRNRIIAGLSRITIVVEASIRSGAVITGDFAFDFNRDLFAIPGEIDKEYSRGTNMLIKDNKATLLCDFQQILNIINS